MTGRGLKEEARGQKPGDREEPRRQTATRREGCGRCAKMCRGCREIVFHAVHPPPPAPAHSRCTGNTKWTNEPLKGDPNPCLSPPSTRSQLWPCQPQFFFFFTFSSSSQNCRDM